MGHEYFLVVKKLGESKGNHGVKGMVNPATAFVTVPRTAGSLCAGIIRVS
jgi:hypothetical protein